jgi:hypothetical protein
LFWNWEANSGLDTSGTATTSALANAAANGYNNDGVTSVVSVNIPPSSGSFAGQAGYAEVIVQFNQKRGFSGIFANGDIPVRARAVARGLWKPFNAGIIILNPRAANALYASGNGRRHGQSTTDFHAAAWRGPRGIAGAVAALAGAVGFPLGRKRCEWAWGAGLDEPDFKRLGPRPPREAEYREP